MGSDEAIKGVDGARVESALATVVELLPSAIVKVQLDSREEVLAHAAGGKEVNFVRMRPGDRVLVEVSPHDRRRGRIVKLLRKT